MSTFIINDNGVNRPMTEAEIANLETIRAENAANAQAAIDRANAKQAVLDKLGLTADEAKALLG
jgi:hypothetical protein